MIFKRLHIVVVGGGIVGASLTYHLSRLHIQVTLIDKASKPAANVTEKSFGWINSRNTGSADYFSLRQQAIADWHRVESDLEVNWKSIGPEALTWHTSTEETERVVHSLLNFGYPVQLINQNAIRLLEPNLKEVSGLTGSNRRPSRLKGLDALIQSASQLISSFSTIEQWYYLSHRNHQLLCKAHIKQGLSKGTGARFAVQHS